MNLAKQVAGKEEFWGLVDWYSAMIKEHGVAVQLNTEVSANDLGNYDEVIIATGVVPRDPQIPGQDAGNVVSYIDYGGPKGRRDRCGRHRVRCV